MTEPVRIDVEAIVGVDGKVRDPLVSDAKGEPTLVSLALEYLRRWEFEPAELEGEKVPVYFSPSMTFPAAH
jgi:outer membrane biosynthesis protein TonB